MIKTIQKSAKTEDEAISLALLELGLTRDDVSVEIVERAKTGFLGLRATPAVVNVSYEEPDVPVTQAKSDRVYVFLEGLLERFGVAAGIEVQDDNEGTISVELTGGDPGALIGRRGETLDAIQHLTNYAVNRGSSPRLRINIDTENYRRRRGDTLEQLAEKTAAKVLKYRRGITLDPMNAYERHVIHTALQDNEHVSTHSVGSEPNRRVVVTYGKVSEQAHDSDSRSRQRPRRTNSEPRAAAQPVKAPQTTPGDYSENLPKETPGYREWK